MFFISLNQTGNTSRRRWIPPAAHKNEQVYDMFYIMCKGVCLKLATPFLYYNIIIYLNYQSDTPYL